MSFQLGYLKAKCDIEKICMYCKTNKCFNSSFFSKIKLKCMFKSFIKAFMIGIACYAILFTGTYFLCTHTFALSMQKPYTEHNFDKQVENKLLTKSWKK